MTKTFASQISTEMKKGDNRRSTPVTSKGSTYTVGVSSTSWMRLYKEVSLRRLNESYQSFRRWSEWEHHSRLVNEEWLESAGSWWGMCWQASWEDLRSSCKALLMSRVIKSRKMNESSSNTTNGTDAKEFRDAKFYKNVKFANSWIGIRICIPWRKSHISRPSLGSRGSSKEPKVQVHKRLFLTRLSHRRACS